MKKNLVLTILIISLIFVFGCGQTQVTPENIYLCKTDSDCIPKPGCHPMECINKNYETRFPKPEACTLMFAFEAAYNKEDCLCQAGKCVNKNIPDPDKIYTEEESLAIAQKFVEKSSTYLYDGFDLKHIETMVYRCPQCWSVSFTFTSNHAGYGDRTGKILADVLTPHEAVVFMGQGKISTAIMDSKWDMIKDSEIANADDNPPSEEDLEKYCERDEDCACGTHIETGDCFVGNTDYVNTRKQCPDFCTGIAGNLITKCINNECTQVNNRKE